jgi:hypothetical protein
VDVGCWVDERCAVRLTDSKFSSRTGTSTMAFIEKSVLRFFLPPKNIAMTKTTMKAKSDQQYL